MDSSTAKKKTKKSANKKTAKTKKVTVAETAEIIEAPVQPIPSEDEGLYVRLSHSLRDKLAELAEDEGLTIAEFLAEIVAEGVVVRAYDQWERRQHMRGGNPQIPSGQGNNQNQRRGNRGNRNNRRNNHKRYQTLMEDNSSFLEYVRNQEKKGNR